MADDSVRRDCAFAILGAVFLLWSGTANPLSAQSTTASLSGTVYDSQTAAIHQAVVVVTHRETSRVLRITTDTRGKFRLTALAPGVYALSVEASGFDVLQAEVMLVLDENRDVELVLAVARIEQRLTVAVHEAALDPSLTVLGRRITAREIAELPVQGRNFLTLALLTPGILSSYNTAASGSGFAAAGQTGRNNTLLVDGLSLDETSSSSPRGGLPLDAVQDFVVASNGAGAEYGQASGAIVNVRTKSGANTFAGGAFLYRRDGAWNATPGSARLAVPMLEKPEMQQTIVGGSAGGPIKRERLFFFAAVEGAVRDSVFIPTSPVAAVIAPDLPSSFPQRLRNPQIFGRVDVAAQRSGQLALQYRLVRETIAGRIGEQDLAAGSWERAHDSTRQDFDLALRYTSVFGRSTVNEFRSQRAGRLLEFDPTGYCDGCPALDYPHLKRGKNPGVPNWRRETQWQIADVLTIVQAGWIGDHTFKSGIDVNWVEVDYDQLQDRDGTFRFETDLSFDPLDPRSYPTRYTRTDGDRQTTTRDTILALFLQDQWRPGGGLTLNLGVRWDYEHSIGLTGDVDNLAPRLGVAFDPWRRGNTSFRASYGIYYDQVFLAIARTALQAQTGTGLVVVNPGYPDPFGPNPARGSTLVTRAPTTTRLAANMETPHTQQITGGIQHALIGTMSLAIDGVWARGQRLLVTRDLNYPDLNQVSPRRPDPLFAQVNSVETSGQSWYRALQIGLVQRHTQRFSFSAAYTLSSSQRDTEDSNFVPQDQRNYAADRGPSLNDARHRLVIAGDVRLPFGLWMATVLTARSALPYNLTTGTDDNRDGNPSTDRPPGVSRNSGRGATFCQGDLRITKTFAFGVRRLDLVAEAFNVTNRSNWTFPVNFVRAGGITHPAPTGAELSRELQFGVRVLF
jgi:hypothetical protein